MINFLLECCLTFADGLLVNPSGVRSTPFRVVSASGVSQIQLGVWWGGGRCKPPSGVWGSAPEAFENYAYNEASFAHFDNNCSIAS